MKTRPITLLTAGGHDIDAMVPEGFTNLLGNAVPAGGVFHVGNDQVDLVPGDQPRDALACEGATWLAEDITDKEQLHGVLGE